MPHDDPYRSWKKARSKVTVPDDFADRVMSSVHRYEAQRRGAAATFVVAMLSSRWGRIVVCSTAGAACLVRLGSWLSIFIVY
jgi:hypothetical protein